MVASANTIIALSGPYTKYGYLLASKCAEQGVNYVDLSGEFFYQRKLIDEIEETAAKTGAKIVVAGGYDSAPFDLSSTIAVSNLPPAKSSSSLTTVVAITEMMHGYLSGGTLASMIVGVGDSIRESLYGKGATYANDPYILTPNMEDCERIDTDPTGWGNIPRYDSTVSSWGVPHFMAYVNSRIVRRSMSMLGVARVSYSEGMGIWSILDAWAWCVPRWVGGEFKLAPNPGEGPSEKLMKEGGYR